MNKKSDFFEHIYEVVKLIPKGRVTSYGSIAKFLSAAKSSRVVGYAMNACHDYDPTIPAHRVVNRNGLLTGKMHFGSPTKMQELLEAEGHEIKGDQIKSFPNVFWDPSEELL